MEYVIEDKDTHNLNPTLRGAVEPEIKHHIKPTGKVAFRVEFYMKLKMFMAYTSLF